MKMCDRTLITSPWAYCLCLTQKQHDKVLEKYGISEIVPEDGRLSGAAATVSFFTSNKGAKIAIVLLGEGYKRHKPLRIYSLLVHEATHIWQAIRESLMEDEASSEFEAYSVQKISHELMLAYNRAIKKKDKK